MYDNGQGVLQDYKTAMKWLELSAKQGNANAQNNLSRLQEKIEKKVEKTVTDEIKAKTKAQEEEWFERQKNQKDLF